MKRRQGEEEALPRLGGPDEDHAAAPDQGAFDPHGILNPGTTIQALWTQAREGLDVTTILLNNRSYAILNLELNRVGAEPPGPRAKSMLDLSRPDLDLVALAKGMGVPASRATRADELCKQLEQALAEPGPSLVEAVIPAIV